MDAKKYFLMENMHERKRDELERTLTRLMIFARDVTQDEKGVRAHPSQLTAESREASSFFDDFIRQMRTSRKKYANCFKTGQNIVLNDCDAMIESAARKAFKVEKKIIIDMYLF